MLWSFPKDRGRSKFYMTGEARMFLHPCVHLLLVAAERKLQPQTSNLPMGQE